MLEQLLEASDGIQLYVMLATNIRSTIVRLNTFEASFRRTTCGTLTKTWSYNLFNLNLFQYRPLSPNLVGTDFKDRRS